jgi:hypothetical protein
MLGKVMMTVRNQMPVLVVFVWGALLHVTYAQESRIGNSPEGDCDSCDCDSVHVERGKPRPVIDSIGWVVGVPSKLLLWDRRVNNHCVSNATVSEVADYLQHRGLTDTVVRVNQYAPAKEWRRLVANKQVGAGWRYTAGSIKWLQYTLLPGRVFGGDEYNPYTNSLHLYSDMPVLGLAEAAYAKDVSTQSRPGTYATVQLLPVVALWHETKATKEVLTYVSIHGSSEQIADVRHDLYARYGIETAGEISRVLPDGTGLFQVIGATVGHGSAAYENHVESTR